VQISVKTDLERFRRDLMDIERRQLPFAVRRALTDTTKAAVADLRNEMTRAFDRPTPFTLNAVYAAKVSGDGPASRYSASVQIRDFAGKGSPASRWLGPEIDGGARRVKRFESRLDKAGAVPAGTMLVPGRAAPLDQYGNVAGPTIVRILSHLRALNPGDNVSPRKLRRLKKLGLLTKTARGDAKYFVAKSKSGGALGVWNVLGRGIVVPVFFFPRKPLIYKPRLDFQGIVAKTAAREFTAALSKRLAEAMKSRR
jgi:hypothetical protein